MNMLTNITIRAINRIHCTMREKQPEMPPFMLAFLTAKSNAKVLVIPIQ